MKTIIEMAREAGFTVATGFDVGPGTAISIPMGSWGVEEIERFAELVRAQENEACALIADEAEPYNAADLIRKRMKK